MIYLADTSVLTRIAVPVVRDVVRAHLAVGAIACCAMTQLELGFSARNESEWDAIQRATDVFGTESVLPEDFRRAGQVQRMLAAAALRGRKVPDLLVAAVAERAGRVVLHYDRDFEHIAGVTGQAQQWVVPPGSVD
ncbi:PIN domain-containing protein [Skermania sp. ID1734]|uniref:PIN domain-containing protein n=1 Tax=Skermania sp. ID1734 TaxID=2597516 RepID=UPI00210406E0|nr:PIN domain-containing protein [Skermania sp. ID1734]